MASFPIAPQVLPALSVSTVKDPTPAEDAQTLTEMATALHWEQGMESTAASLRAIAGRLRKLQRTPVA